MSDLIHSATAEQQARRRKAAARVHIFGRVVQRLLYALFRQRVAVLLVLLVAASISTYELWLSRNSGAITAAVASGTAPIEVTVQDVQGSVNNATLTLKEKNGSRRIAMSVSGSEAIAIALSKQAGSVQIPRDQQPQAYDLMRELIQNMGGRLDRVVVNDATQREYLAQVVVSAAGETHIIRARPGDAVALALKTQAPIFVEDSVLDRFGTKGSG